MTKVLFLLGLFLVQLLSCGKSDDTDYITAEANLLNRLAVDGCGWHFSIPLKEEFNQYAASENSQDKVDAIILSTQNMNGLYDIKVKITYAITGKKKDVQCGWGKINAMDEIELKEIIKL